MRILDRRSGFFLQRPSTDASQKERPNKSLKFSFPRVSLLREPCVPEPTKKRWQTTTMNPIRLFASAFLSSGLRDL